MFLIDCEVHCGHIMLLFRAAVSVLAVLLHYIALLYMTV